MHLNVGNKALKRGTNILDVNVPPELRVKHSSGIDWINDALGGEGFTPSTAMMVTGEPGAGKTTLMLQIADALTSAGHVALLNSGEESHYQVKMVAERLKLKHGFIIGQDDKLQDLLEHADQIRAENPQTPGVHPPGLAPNVGRREV